MKARGFNPQQAANAAAQCLGMDTEGSKRAGIGTKKAGKGTNFWSDEESSSDEEKEKNEEK